MNNINDLYNLLINYQCLFCGKYLKYNVFYYCCGSSSMSVYEINNINFNTYISDMYYLNIRLKDNNLNIYLENYTSKNGLSKIYLKELPIKLINNSLSPSQAIEYCESLFNYI